MLKMSIGTVLFDQAKGAAVVTLVEDKGDRVLPIFIGMWEGMAIFREINRSASHRPLLHDLFFHILQGFQAHLEQVVVTALEEGTYYAQLHITSPGTTMIVDARPSDAFALALKFQAPIYVAEAVLEAAGKRGDFALGSEAPTVSAPEPGSSEDIQSWLENIRPEDFADPK